MICSHCIPVLSLHIVGKGNCLVLLFSETARRESRCPQYRVKMLCNLTCLFGNPLFFVAKSFVITPAFFVTLEWDTEFWHPAIFVSSDSALLSLTQPYSALLSLTKADQFYIIVPTFHSNGRWESYIIFPQNIPPILYRRVYELCLRHSLALLGSELQHSPTLVGGETPPNPPPRVHYTILNPNILTKVFSWLWTFGPK